MSPTADLLAKVTCPVLVIGPHVGSGWRGDRARLLSCVGPGSRAEATIAQMTRWSRTFGCEEPRFIEVIEPVGRLRGAKRGAGIDARTPARGWRFEQCFLACVLALAASVSQWSTTLRGAPPVPFGYHTCS